MSGESRGDARGGRPRLGAKLFVSCCLAASNPLRLAYLVPHEISCRLPSCASRFRRTRPRAGGAGERRVGHHSRRLADRGRNPDGGIGASSRTGLEDLLACPGRGRDPARVRLVGLLQHRRTLLPLAETRSLRAQWHAQLDRKSTRLNSSHVKISYAVFCLKKKKLYN